MANKAKNIKRWSDKEDKLLFDTLRVYGYKGNRYCFMVVAEQIQRTVGAVSAHWYTVLSKKDYWVGSYVTETYCTKNRRNGAGTPLPTGTWKKVLRMIKSLF